MSKVVGMFLIIRDTETFSFPISAVMISLSSACLAGMKESIS